MAVFLYMSVVRCNTCVVISPIADALVVKICIIG